MAAPERPRDVIAGYANSSAVPTGRSRQRAYKAIGPPDFDAPPVLVELLAGEIQSLGVRWQTDGHRALDAAIQANPVQGVVTHGYLPTHILRRDVIGDGGTGLVRPAIDNFEYWCSYSTRW